jgi:hypothetical protein
MAHLALSKNHSLTQQVTELGDTEHSLGYDGIVIKTYIPWDDIMMWLVSPQCTTPGRYHDVAGKSTVYNPGTIS